MAKKWLKKHAHGEARTRDQRRIRPALCQTELRELMLFFSIYI